MSGDHPYASEAYARALSASGGLRPIPLPEWSAWLLARPIEEGGEDAAGPYPRIPLPPDARLEEGLARLADEGLVSVVLAVDPLASPTPQRLRQAFEVCRPFKTHHVIDRAAGAYAPSKHHRYEIRRAAARSTVEVVPLGAHLGDWTGLYDGLVERRSISGAAAFSRSCFEALAADRRFVAFVAKAGGRVVAMALWFQHDGVAVNHLAASSDEGYALGASYALYDAAIAHFGDARLLDLGACAGLADDPADGLARFKRGFANATATAWLCGAVLDRRRYDALAAGRDAAFFPAYRG